jgi:hypothetical protein
LYTTHPYGGEHTKYIKHWQKISSVPSDIMEKCGALKLSVKAGD